MCLSLALFLAAPFSPFVAAAHAGAKAAPRIPALVDKYALKYGIPLHIARNLVRVESGGRQDAVSRSGARGVMQLLPETARALGVDINDPEQNIEGGMRYLRDQYDRFGRWHLALAAYHAGPAAVARYHGVPPASQAFVKRVLGDAPPSAARGGSSAASRGSSSAVSGHRLAFGFVWPVQGMLTARFNRGHRGIDLATPHGTPIRAARAGRVAFVGRYYDYGRTVILDHGGGVSTLYGHTSAVLVRPGQSVAAGQVIARVGCTGRCTGPHVHFEVRVNGRAVDPLKELPAPSMSSMTETARPDASRAPQGAALTGDFITRVTETFQNGQVVRRVEETVLILEGNTRMRITREYRTIGGVLVLVSERAEIYTADDDEDR